MNTVESSLEQLRQRQTTLPFVTAHVPAVTGVLKQTPEDFEVEEIPAYLPSGEGEHLYLWIEKRELNTPDAARHLARALQTRPENAGWAGLKDRRAVTRQWISFQCPTTPTPESLDVPGVRVLSVSRHANKLRTGHLRGNRFRLRLAGVPDGQERHVEEALAHLQQVGLPAYFGTQRFGFGGKNLTNAYAWIVGGERAPQKPFLRKLFVSALQGALFNAWLGDRIENKTFGSALLGDLMRKEDTGGIFLCEDPATDGARIERWEISPTGPMFGARMKAPTGDALARENEQLARYGVTMEHLSRVERFGEGTRRPARVRPDQVSTERAGADLVLEFRVTPRCLRHRTCLGAVKTRELSLSEES
ncbi:MAG: tRNA pseudouridine(13) synthase TruD [Myxococcales bacterium]